MRECPARRDSGKTTNNNEPKSTLDVLDIVSRSKGGNALIVQNHRRRRRTRAQAQMQRTYSAKSIEGRSGTSW